MLKPAKTQPASKRFEFQSLPSRVIFGSGRLQEVGAELERMGIERAAVLSTADQASQAANLAAMIGARTGVIYPGAKMHTPVEVTISALREVEAARADGIVAIGGGSTIGLGKALAYRTDLPQLVIPTTYAGSEMTPILGQTERGVKTTLRSPRVQPETVIYDPDLTVTLPPFISGPSGMNAIAHAVEALYAEDTNPVICLMAEESIRAFGRSLVPVMTDGNDISARGEALYGAWLAGTCLGSVAMSIHHKICHTLGGTFDLPHADIHCLMIAYSAAYNRDAAPEAMSRVARALDADDGPGALYELMLKVASKTSLAAFGLSEADLDKAADLAVQNPYYNPRTVTRDGVRDMLQSAFEGRRP
ncbi:maleylacetate reductase [Sinorhizobium meliloti]|uniref:maleylacetate reductase n=1 Tax=Rhizobium meliloti TaxID=382 RepID=UPI003F1681A1